MQTLRLGRRACWRGVALLALLVSLEAVIVRSVGPLGAQVRVLGGLGDPSGDAVAGLLTVLAVTAELLAAYLLLILALRLAAWLPGASGRLARRGAGLLTLPALRRGLDGLLGGVLLAQVVLAPVAARAALVAQPDRPPAAAASALVGGSRIASVSEPGGVDLRPSVAGRSRTGAGQSPGAVEHSPTTTGDVPGMARALPATSTVPPPAWVPLPTWLGGSQEPGADAPGSTTAGSVPGSGAAEPTLPQASDGEGPEANAAGDGMGLIDPAETRSYVIQPGDTLWEVAEAHISPSQRSASRIDRYWRQVHAANRDVLGDDPDLIHPGVRVVLPSFQPARTGGG
jgi:hypothetical protein